MTTLIISRPNEMTAVLNRDKFDQVPGGIESSTEIARWEQYRRNYHLAQQLHEFADFPLQIDFELNSNCNMRCRHCLHSQKIVEKKELALVDFKKVIDEGERYGLCSIKLNYINEPLLKPDLVQYIKYAKAHGILNVYFATNGILLTQSVGKQLIEAKLSKIMISIDAVTSQTFVTMRDSYQFNRIVENIKSFIQLRNKLRVDYPLVRVNFLKTRDNIHEAQRFIDYWTGIADMIGFQDQVGVPGIIAKSISNCSKAALQNYKAGFRCSFPFKMVVVDSMGSILPCCTFSGREMPLGHIDTMTIKEAWNSSKMARLRAIHKNSSYIINKVCRYCIESIGIED